MPALDVLGDPVHRRLLELLAEGERPAGQLAAVVHAEFGISQPAASQHLKVLRENGFARVRAEGTRRLSAVDPAALREVDAWLARFRRSCDRRLDALATELARGARARSETAGEGLVVRPEGDTRDLIDEIVAAHRDVVRRGETEAKLMAVTARRRCDAAVAGVWDAVTVLGLALFLRGEPVEDRSRGRRRRSRCATTAPRSRRGPRW